MPSGLKSLFAKFISSSLLAISIFAGPVAIAADSKGQDLFVGLRFATVLRMHGDVTAVAASSGKERKLSEGDAVFVGDRVRAAPTAEAVLKTGDAGMIAVRPGGDFVAERFAAEGKRTDSLTVRLFGGSLRMITGWIGRINGANHKTITPTATIGVRGTDHEPYVLSGEMAASTGNRPGTYDKVNRGGTLMTVGDNKLDIAPGQVGFVRQPNNPDEPHAKTRLLMTILLPVLLDKVPNFYVPGRFDAELDRYSETSVKESQRELDIKRNGLPSAQGVCDVPKLAKIWLKQLDSAAVKRDASGIIVKFSPDVTVRATVRDNDGKTSTVDLGRDELAQSTVTAIKGLTAYKHRRVSIEATSLGTDECDRLKIKSIVIEQGRQSGKPYRFESVEEYVLELRDGKWLATKAETTQR